MDNEETEMLPQGDYDKGFDDGYALGSLSPFQMNVLTQHEESYSEYDLGIVDGIRQSQRDTDRQGQLQQLDSEIQQESEQQEHNSQIDID